MTNSRSIVLMLVAGLLGAILSCAALLVSASADLAFNGYANWIVDELPVLFVVTGLGFVLGMLVVLVWSVLMKLFAEGSPSA